MLHVVAEEALSVTKDACCEPSDCRTGRLRLGGIVLAAGAGSSLGGRAKGLIEIEGEPLVERTLRVLREVGVDELVVVTGHYRAQLESWLESAAVVEVTQPLDTHTQADSLRLGVAGLSENIDAVMVLPGGAGSLDELFEVLTWRQLGLHDKPVFLVNVKGYWNPLLALLDHMVAQGFADAALRDYFKDVPNAAAALEALT